MGAKTKKTHDHQHLQPIYVVFGKDRRRVTDKLDEITQFVLADADPQMAMTVYDGDQAALADVLDDLKTLPFLTTHRLVVVKDADPFISEHRQSLEQYLQAPSPTGVLLLMAQSFPGNTRLAKIAATCGQVYPCEPIKPRQLPGFLASYARENHALALKPAAAALLIELSGDDAGNLMSEVDKLAAYIADPNHKRNTIEPDDIQALVGNNRQFNVFNVIDAMTAGQADSALKRLDHMFAQDREAQFTAVGAFAWHFRRLYQARVLLDKRQPPQTVISVLRIWSQPDQFINQTKRLTIRQVAHILRNLAKIDLDSKTAGPNVRTALEKLIVQFCHAVERAA